MNGAVLKLVVDNTQHNSQAVAFLLKQHSIFDGKAEVVRTKTSGGIWHFRMWVTDRFCHSWFPESTNGPGKSS